MKKFTLLIALLLCFVAFGQERVGTPSIEYPTKAKKSPIKKQVSNKSDLPFDSFSAVPAEVYAGMAARSAGANAKKTVTLTSDPAAAMISALRRSPVMLTTVLTPTADAVDAVEGSTLLSGPVSYMQSTYNGANHSRSLVDLAYTSGPYFNVAGNPDLSVLENVTLGMNTLGAGMQVLNNNRIAEDIVLTDDYDVTELVFYGYQTGAPTSPPTINEINVQIWDGDPSVGGSSVIWGDDVTNVLGSAVWSNAYRQAEDNPGTTRAIYRVTVDATGLSLPAGTYWVDWQMGGTLASGPWQPPVVILGQSTTGNALQSLAGTWGPLLDTGTATALGAPIEVYGDCTSCGGGGGGACNQEHPLSGLGAGGTGSSVDSAFKSAADILVATGEDFTIDNISTYFLTLAPSDPPTTANVVYYEDASGFPGAVIGSETVVPTVLSSQPWAPNPIADQYEMTMAVTPFTFPGDAGSDTTYWIEVSMGTATNQPTVFWMYTDDTPVEGSPYVQFDAGTGTWSVPDPIREVVYDFAGECAPIGGGGGGCTAGTFTDRASFEAAFGGTLINEDFTGGPGAITSCDGPINSGGNSCYPAGEIEEGIDVRSLIPTDPNNDTVVIPVGALGNTDVLVGPNTFVDILEIQFPNDDVSAFGVDIALPLIGSPTDVNLDIYGASGLIETITVTIPNGSTIVFAGYIAEENIASVEIASAGGGAEGELIANAAFGLCEGGGGGGGCGDFTYENVSPTGNGVPSQIFPDFPDFDSEAVDDVVLPGPDAGELCSLDITGSGAGLPIDPNNTVVLTVYTDNGGVPGSVAFTETFPGSVDADGDGSFTLEPTGAPVLNPNTTYWVSVVAVMEFGVSGQWFWSSADDGNDAAALWQNPGGGFGLCPTWGTFADCTVGGGLGPDLLMSAEFVAVELVTFDDCEGALPISCGDSLLGSSIGATPDNAPDCDTSTQPGVWYKFVDDSGLASNYVLTTCSPNTDYDTKVSVYSGDCNNLVCVAGNDDDPNCPNFQTTVEFSGDGATTYYILVHGFAGATGNFELSLTCECVAPPNDDIADAINLIDVGCPFTDEAVAMPCATLEDGTPSGCDISGANGVWYVFTPELDGFITGTIGTPGDAPGTNLSVNNGPLAGNYSPVAASFGGAIPFTPLTQDAVVVIDDDTTGDPNDACDPIINGGDLNGKFAILKRGSCEFGLKALAAQNEGAVAVVVVNNQPGDPIVMGGGEFGDQVTIPVVMISDVEGNPIIAEILGGNTVNMTLSSDFPGVSSVTFYTAPDESSTEDELVWVDWWQNQCLPSETATIPVVAGQTYYCFVVNSGAVTDIIFDNCQLGVDSNEIEGFAFYPNPTNDIVNLSSVENIEKVALYNILGQKLMDLNVNATTTELNVSNLAAGAYLMEVTVDGQKGTYKVIKR